MTPATALREARTLLNLHGLQDWSVQLDHARQRCGSCHFKGKKITLSRHFIELNDAAEIEATILHEIAHALAGPRAGHGLRWRKIATQIGAPVSATNSRAVMPAPPWGLKCNSCSQVVARRHRRTLHLEHIRCKGCGVTDGLLNWVRLG